MYMYNTWTSSNRYYDVLVVINAAIERPPNRTPPPGNDQNNMPPGGQTRPPWADNTTDLWELWEPADNCTCWPMNDTERYEDMNRTTGMPMRDVTGRPERTSPPDVTVRPEATARPEVWENPRNMSEMCICWTDDMEWWNVTSPEYRPDMTPPPDMTRDPDMTPPLGMKISYSYF